MVLMISSRCSRIVCRLASNVRKVTASFVSWPSSCNLSTSAFCSEIARSVLTMCEVTENARECDTDQIEQTLTKMGFAEAVDNLVTEVS